jgi:hypothetical protein
LSARALGRCVPVLPSSQAPVFCAVETQRLDRAVQLSRDGRRPAYREICRQRLSGLCHRMATPRIVPQVHAIDLRCCANFYDTIRIPDTSSSMMEPDVICGDSTRPRWHIIRSASALCPPLHTDDTSGRTDSSVNRPARRRRVGDSDQLFVHSHTPRARPDTLYCGP